jgi:hypothetical protein
VDRVLAARLRGWDLQYRVQWLHYDTDHEWYNASNFRNSPLKLLEFHRDDSGAPGPPVGLTYWERRWVEGSDANDFSDDNRPIKATSRRCKCMNNTLQV